MQPHEHTAASSWLSPLAGLNISMSLSWSLRSECCPSSASASISVTSVECESFDSTGLGSTVAGYGEGGGCKEWSEPTDALESQVSMSSERNV